MLKKSLGIALLMTILISLHFRPPVMGILATISVEPHISKVWGIGEVFTVNITVTEIANLYGWEVTLYYNPSILNGTSVSEGYFLNSAGETYFNSTLDDNFNATTGRIKAFSSLIGEIPGVDGTGVLFTVAFNTMQLGISPLDLEDTILADINSNKIVHTAISGGVQVVKAVHDVAILSTSVSSDILVSGQTLAIYVTAANLGNKTETFQVSAYYNETVISEETVSELSPKTDTVLTFLWDTSPVVPDATCIIKAQASQVLGETNLENNVLVYGTVAVVQGIHDVAIIDVTPASTEVYEGEMLNIYVLAGNNGNYTETFNVTVYRDDIVIGQQSVVNLTYESMSGLTFSWDTEDVESNRTYMIKAVASTVEEETNLENNILTGDNVTVYPQGSLSIVITEVVPCNQFGQPVTSFLRGTMASFKLTIDCTLFGAKNILLVINLYDATNNPLGVVSFHGPVASGITTFILGMPIPSTANIGGATVYANVLSNWPHLGGTPYGPEMSATFEITGT